MSAVQEVLGIANAMPLNKAIPELKSSGFMVSYEVKESDHGLGLFAKEFIPKGSLICMLFCICPNVSFSRAHSCSPFSFREVQERNKCQNIFHTRRCTCKTPRVVMGRTKVFCVAHTRSGIGLIYLSREAVYLLF